MCVQYPFVIYYIFQLNLCGNSLEKIYKLIPKHKLPAEYMPDGEENQSAGTMKDIVGK